MALIASSLARPSVPQKCSCTETHFSSECAADCKKYEGCKKYDCKTPEDCASLGGENHGKHNQHSGALAWSTGVAAVTVAASTVAFL